MRQLLLLTLSLFTLASGYADQSSEHLTQCVSLPLTYSELNIPQSRINLNGKEVEIVIDLGLKNALALQVPLTENLNDSKAAYQSILHSDLTGAKRIESQKILDAVNINGMLFNRVEISQAKPWGVWINTTADKHNLPKNTLGRDLFLNESGVLYYSRKNEILRWCKTPNPIQSQTSNRNIVWLPLQEDNEGIRLMTYHQNKPLYFVFDSAATFSIIKPQTWLKLLPNDIVPDNKSLVYLEDLDIAGKKLKTLVYQYDLPKNFKADGLMGDSFFKNVDLIIDTVNKMIGLIFLDEGIRPVV